MNLEIFEDDLSYDTTEKLLNSKYICIDTETMGLNIYRDRLCLVQMTDENDNFVVVKVKSKNVDNLKRLLESDNLKIFHYARFDVAILKYQMNINVNNIYCTKIASKLARTYTDKHGLKDVIKDLLNIDIDKTYQCSDWGNTNLTDRQINYALNDVKYLVPLMKKLNEMLIRENRLNIAQKIFSFIPTMAELDILGWNESIFAH
jgi:ribonuclease D